jgi:hypothetical protein
MYPASSTDLHPWTRREMSYETSSEGQGVKFTMRNISICTRTAKFLCWTVERFKKSFAILRTYVHLFIGHVHRFEMWQCTKVHRALSGISVDNVGSLTSHNPIGLHGLLWIALLSFLLWLPQAMKGVSKTFTKVFQMLLCGEFNLNDAVFTPLSVNVFITLSTQ